jgi:hypothetical protein
MVAQGGKSSKPAYLTAILIERAGAMAVAHHEASTDLEYLKPTSLDYASPV